MTTISENPTIDPETEEARQLVINAAVDSFLKRGFPESSMPAIVEESGVAPDVAYALFPDKYDVLRALAEYNRTSGTEMLKGLAKEDSLPPVADLLARVLGFFESMAASGAPAGLVPQSLGLSLFDEDINVIMQGVASSMKQAWVGLATRLQEEGRLREGTDVQDVGATFLALGMGFMIYHMMGGIDAATLNKGLHGLNIDG